MECISRWANLLSTVGAFFGVNAPFASTLISISFFPNSVLIFLIRLNVLHHILKSLALQFALKEAGLYYRMREHLVRRYI